jgi:outer membrane translocation and assembly module TamA
MSEKNPVVDKTNVHSLNFFQLFGLDATVVAETGGQLDPPTAALVKKSFRRLSLKFHPDKDPSPDARAAFERLKEAADTITNAERCRGYVATFAKAAAKRESVQHHVDKTEHFRANLRRREEEERQKDALKREAEEETRRTRGEGGVGSRLAQAEAVAALRRLMMSSWRQIEVDMVGDWEVGPEELAAKERDVLRMIASLEQSMAPRSTALENAKRMRAALTTSQQPQRPQPV